jgi:hypothetical protein
MLSLSEMVVEWASIIDYLERGATSFVVPS